MQGIDHSVLEKLLSMISPEFGAEIPLFPLEQLQEGEFLQSAVHCAQLFANVQLEVLEVIRSSHSKDDSHQLLPSFWHNCGFMFFAERSKA